MSIEGFIVDAVNQSVMHVFSTMLDVCLTPGQASFEDFKSDPDCEIVSFIGLAGAWVGSGSLNCSAAFACRASAALLMTEAPAVNEEVLDAVAELTNMIVGGVKTELELKLGPLGLSIPTVVYGRNFKTKTAAAANWIVVRFRWDRDDLVVKLCLAPRDRNPRHHIHLCDGLGALAS